MSKLVTYCWDANIFIAWLGGEEQYLPAISALLDELEEGKAALVLPAIVYCEVIEYHRTRKDMHTFRGFLKRSNILVYDVTERMATVAAEVRSKAKAAKPSREVGTCDALYIATAMITQAHAFHTTETRLLGLNKSAAVSGLQICKPQTKSGATSMF